MFCVALIAILFIHQTSAFEYESVPIPNGLHGFNKILDWKNIDDAGILEILPQLKSIIPNKMISDLTGANPQQLMEVLESKKLSLSCFLTIKQFCLNVYQHISQNDTAGLVNYLTETQALYYFDAWPKIPERLLLGNTGWYGAYDECKLINDAHYCLADMTINLDGHHKLPGYYGTCVPKNCSNSDVYVLLTILKQLKCKDCTSVEECLRSNCAPHFLPIQIYNDRQEKACFEDVGFKVQINSVLDFPNDGSLSSIGGPVLCNDPIPTPPEKTAFIVVFALLVTLTVLGTIMEGLQDCLTPEHLVADTQIIQNDGEEHNKDADQLDTGRHQRYAVGMIERTRGNTFTNLLMCFSALKNTRAIFDTKSSKGMINCLNGVRAISITWVILGHVYFFAIYIQVDNIGTVSESVISRFSFEAIANAYVSVDSFFFLSGLLVAYIALKHMDATEGRLNILQFYLHRFIRLTPSYMFTIFLYKSYYPYIIDSPIGTRLKHQSDNCKTYWWTNLLYINNFYPKGFTEQCLGWSWYLANDMQFYIISPLFLYIMYRFKLRGAVLSIGIGVLSCIVVNASIIGAVGYPALITEAWTAAGRDDPAFLKKVTDSGAALYDKPYTRIAPYLIGLFTGFCLSRKVYLTTKRNLPVALFGWIIAFGMGMAVIYGPYTVFKKGGDNFTMVENIFYGSFARVAWALALAWVVYACHHKMGGVVNSVLSWSGWMPFSRLTYGAYLLHPIILMYYYYALDNPLHYQDHTSIFRYLSVLVASYTLAFAMALLVDLPVFNLEKFITRKLSRPKQNKFRDLNS